MVAKKISLKNSPPKIKYEFGQVFSDATAFQMVNILKGVVERGTAKKIRNLNLEVGGKPEPLMIISMHGLLVSHLMCLLVYMLVLMSLLL